MESMNLADGTQKTFISAREFLESWDKEIYEMTNLDLFIYLMVNHVGNQLEKRYFASNRQNSPLQLTFNDIGTLCFNLGDSFEYFLEEEGYVKRASHDFWEAETRSQAYQNESEGMTQRKKRLKTFFSGGLVREQSFRVELMENVILDTLIQFYYEELGIEIEEDDLELIRLADFIEDVIINFIRQEGKSLLQRPADPAMDSFEGLLESEDDYDPRREWEEGDEEEGVYHEDAEWAGIDAEYEDIFETIQRFIDEAECDSRDAGCVSRDIELFREFLTESAEITTIYEVCEEHFLEFMSIWLIQKTAQVPDPPFSRIFQTLARFVTWLAHNYNLDYKHSFLKYYEQVKTEVPRVVRALNTYLDEYSLFEVMIYRDDPDIPQMAGFYEVKRMRNRLARTFDLVNVHLFDQIDNVKLNSSVYSRLKTGDILAATLIQQGNRWEVLEIQFIYPKASRPFVD